MWTVIVAAALIVIVVSYALLSRQSARQTPIATPIAIVIAHPDDESMFFVPTLANLLEKTSVHLFCLSHGDSEGLGRIRTKELEAACQVLKLGQKPVAINDERLQDGFHQIWSNSVVRGLIDDFLQKHAIKSVVTFDDFGVSGHPNHIAISKALGEEPPIGVDVYVLESLPLWRKYLGPLNLLIEASRIRLRSDTVFVTSNPLLSYNAMKQHSSQFVWFRHLFVLFSSYTFVNRLRRVHL